MRAPRNAAYSPNRWREAAGIAGVRDHHDLGVTGEAAAQIDQVLAQAALGVRGHDLTYLHDRRPRQAQPFAGALQTLCWMGVC